VGALRPAATGSPWSKYRPPSARAVVKSAARTITARHGAARARAREAGAKKTAGVSDPVSEHRRFRPWRRAEARARGAASNTSPKMKHTAAVMVDATVDIVARRCARVVVMARVGWFGFRFFVVARSTRSQSASARCGATRTARAANSKEARWIRRRDV